MDREHEPGPIASRTTVVLSSFRSLVNALAGNNDEDTPQIILDNEAVRFRMWASNLAAHQSGRVSLDHRLQDVPHLQKQALYLLDDLNDSLRDATAITSHEDPPSLLSADSNNNDDDDSSSSFSLSSFCDIEVSPSARMQTVYADIREAIDCLLRLSVAMANPTPHKRFRRLGGGDSENMSRFEAYDIRHVRDKFPHAADELHTILGRAITRRRQFFEYRKADHARLAAGLEENSKLAQNNMTNAGTAPTEIVPMTVASSLPEYLKKTEINTKPGLLNTIDEDQQSDSDIAQTPYASSTGSITAEQGLKELVFKPPPPLRVPPIPDTTEEGICECPLCYRMIIVTSRGSWKRHVFGDLRPYTCLFPHCAESNEDFGRRHRWQLHVAKIHWRTWTCPFQCSRHNFLAAEDLKLHIHSDHLPNATQDRLNVATALGETAAPDDKTNPCPLCGHTLTGLKTYIKHVGRHLEQLALYALPPAENEISQEDDDSEVGTVSEDNNSLDEVHEPDNLLPVARNIPTRLYQPAQYDQYYQQYQQPQYQAYQPYQPYETFQSYQQYEADQTSAWYQTYSEQQMAQQQLGLSDDVQGQENPLVNNQLDQDDTNASWNETSQQTPSGAQQAQATAGPSRRRRRTDGILISGPPSLNEETPNQPIHHVGYRYDEIHGSQPRKREKGGRRGRVCTEDRATARR